MVWAGVPLHHKTKIVFINGNLTAAFYKHEVLDTGVIPLSRNHRGMHRASATPANLNANNVNVIVFPPPQITKLKHN